MAASFLMNTFHPPATTRPPAMAQVSQLKRTRSIEGGDAHERMPPPLPQISVELMLSVFTHKSLRRSGSVSEKTADAEQYDNERLSILGSTVFSSVVTDILFRRRPHFVAEDIQKIRHSIIHGGIIDSWIALYRLQEKLRYAPNVVISKEKDEHRHSVFYAYIGAVFLKSGAGAVDDWIGRLLSQEADYQDLSIGMTAARFEATTSPPPPKRVKSEAPSPMIPPTSLAPSVSQQGLPSYRQTGHQLHVLGRLQQHPTQSQPYTGSYTQYGQISQQSFSQHQRQPQQQVRQAPAHVGLSQQPRTLAAPQAGNQTNPLSPAQPNLAFLPLFNQRAVQRRVQVEYLPSFSGPPHAGQWTVQCVVNGIVKGVGYGSSKQLAKEEAARQAYYSMGWS